MRLGTAIFGARPPGLTRSPGPRGESDRLEPQPPCVAHAHAELLAAVGADLVAVHELVVPGVVRRAVRAVKSPNRRLRPASSPSAGRSSSSYPASIGIVLLCAVVAASAARHHVSVRGQGGERASRR